MIGEIIIMLYYTVCYFADPGSVILSNMNRCAHKKITRNRVFGCAVKYRQSFNNHK